MRDAIQELVSGYVTMSHGRNALQSVGDARRRSGTGIKKGFF